MDVLLWNVKRGPGERRLEWIASQPWDVAILLEVTRSGWQRLARDDRWTASSSCEDGGTPGRYATAILTRAAAKAVSLAPPRIDVLDGRYQERVHAVSVRTNRADWTILAVHTPNSVQRNGTRDHGPKDDFYRALSGWVKSYADAGRVVVGIDTNRGDWPLSKGPLRPHGRFVQEFLRDPSPYGLRDVLHEDTSITARPQTYWTTRSGKPYGHYYDRILVSPSVQVRSGPVFHEGVGRGPDRLSDHAAVTVSLSDAAVRA